ncbi:protein transport protein Sec24B isoform X1 [Lampetra fluviatilis]
MSAPGRELQRDNGSAHNWYPAIPQPGPYNAYPYQSQPAHSVDTNGLVFPPTSYHHHHHHPPTSAQHPYGHHTMPPLTSGQPPGSRAPVVVGQPPLPGHLASAPRGLPPPMQHRMAAPNVQAGEPYGPRKPSQPYPAMPTSHQRCPPPQLATTRGPPLEPNCYQKGPASSYGYQTHAGFFQQVPNVTATTPYALPPGHQAAATVAPAPRPPAAAAASATLRPPSSNAAAPHRSALETAASASGTQQQQPPRSEADMTTRQHLPAANFTAGAHPPRSHAAPGVVPPAALNVPDAESMGPAHSAEAAFTSHQTHLSAGYPTGMRAVSSSYCDGSGTATPLSSSSAADDDSDSDASCSSDLQENCGYDALEDGGYSDLDATHTCLDRPPGSNTQRNPPQESRNTKLNCQQSTYSNSPAHIGRPAQQGGYSGLGELSARMQGLALQRSPRDSSGMPYDDMRPVDLLQERFVLPPTPMPAPRPRIHTHLSKRNCSPEVLRSTLMNLPQSPALLAKAKLPLGLVLHPFKDLAQLPVITSSVIVRCRSCRTYINPFVAFIDQRRWRCNICYRINDAPEEFMYNPVTRSYGEPQKRPEVLNSTVEFIAPSEYMLRPPQPAVYLFLFDVSYGAIDSGYLSMVCESLLENLDRLPGDSRTKIGFVTFDSSVHFYQMHESLSQPHMLVVPDIDDVFIPTSEHLLVNLQDRKELVRELVRALPERFRRTHETRSALGPALQAAHKLVAPTGGRVTVFQTQLPNLGHGALQSREDPNVRASTKNVQHLRPGTDFYKKLALDCSGHQIAVDLFLLSGQYADLATLACVSRYSSGTVYFYPSFHRVHTPVQVERLEKDLQRYLTRKIGFEAVMRIRCSKGVSIHTFHGNFFVRSTDLLSLPNVNPDAGFAVQMSIDETLTDTTLCSFQAALLYTSSKGDRRIRVHTLCLPVVNTLAEIYHGADVQAIMGLLATMAVERSVTSSLPDARDALVNAVADSLSGFRSTVSNLQQGGLVAPRSLSLLPLYVHALLKHTAFRLGTSTRLDERVFAMCQMKSQPLVHLMPMIHPHLYRIDNLMQQVTMNINDKSVPQPPILQLSSEHLNTDGAFLLDCGSVLYIWVGRNCSNRFIKDVLGFPNYISIPNTMVDLPELDNTTSERTRDFLSWIREPRPFHSTQHVIKDDSTNRTIFIEHLVEDRSESSMSYSEFLQHIQRQICK